MRKRILLGSIIAVVVIIFVSFTSVVGFQSVNSDSKIESPLFGVINNRGEVSSNYLGKEKEINILLPVRNRRDLIISQFIEMITTMSDKEFEDFIQIIINKISTEKLNFNEELLVDELYKFRENNLENNGNIIYNIEGYNKHPFSTSSDWITACNPVPFCIPINIIVVLVVVPILLILLSVLYIITSLFDCHGTYTFLGALCN